MLRSGPALFETDAGRDEELPVQRPQLARRDGARRLYVRRRNRTGEELPRGGADRQRELPRRSAGPGVCLPDQRPSERRGRPALYALFPGEENEPVRRSERACGMGAQRPDGRQPARRPVRGRGSELLNRGSSLKTPQDAQSPAGFLSSGIHKKGTDPFRKGPFLGERRAGYFTSRISSISFPAPAYLSMIHSTKRMSTQTVLKLVGWK